MADPRSACFESLLLDMPSDDSWVDVTLPMIEVARRRIRRRLADLSRDRGDLCDAVLLACELIFRMPGQAQSLSTVVTTKEGIRTRLPVPEHARYKVF